MWQRALISGEVLRFGFMILEFYDITVHNLGRKKNSGVGHLLWWCDHFLYTKSDLWLGWLVTYTTKSVIMTWISCLCQWFDKFPVFTGGLLTRFLGLHLQILSPSQHGVLVISVVVVLFILMHLTQFLHYSNRLLVAKLFRAWMPGANGVCKKLNS